MTNPTNVIPTDRGAPDVVGIKSYFERIVMEQDRLRQTELSGLRTEIKTDLMALRTEMTARFDASDKALVIQLTASEKALLLKANENDRRLDALNGEAGRLAVILAKSVPREVWEESQKALDVWKAGVDKQLNQNSGREVQQSIGKVDIAKYVGWLLAVIGIAWAMYKSSKGAP